ncbi:MAG TPA: hypothetical protein PKA88_28215 [Polyangiaceae bacterium]|nr:hypothetical protein [Polyangiaceae bacterium]HMR79962.1 hypothetical protein [Polyangiaceae bacterium]
MHSSLRYGLVGFSILCCGGQTLDVGSDGANAPITGSGGGGGNASSACEYAPSAPATWVDPADCVVSTDSPLVGTWVAEVVAHPQVETLTLSIEGIGAAGELCGSVSYGAGPPLPVPQDPSAAFPPSSAHYQTGQGGNPSSWGPIRGASYSLVETVLNPPFVEFDTLLFEPWRDWCALQTSFSWGNASLCGCLPNLPVTMVSGRCYLQHGEASVEYPCAQVTLCSTANVCECTSAGCTAARKGNDPFRLQFDGVSLVGTWQSKSVVFNRE